ncbi:MAG: NTP transferase domain-containing protein [Synergistaceae bacterium]|jgi:putative nucleotidyltransferase with HDIG domain|nr:NTP transferase domain-containing protein [Synergistaceae bacterium]
MMGISAVILAGGFASRMGRCKPLLPISGVSALETAAARLQAAGISEITVVTGHDGGQIAGEARRLGIGVVSNPDYKSGMFSSVVVGVKALFPGTEAFFLLPADIPLVKTHTYLSLMEAWAATGADVVYPTFRGVRAHPPLISFPLAEGILSWTGEGGLGGFLENSPHSSAEIPAGDRAVTLDMDTPEDYERLIAYAKTEFFPDEEECDEILRIEGTSDGVVRHARVVAKVADAIAAALSGGGVGIDRRLLASASLLHDIAKGRHDHDAEGARMLRRRGMFEVADVVASHKDLPESGTICEKEVLYLADKMTVGTSVLTIEERMSKLELKFSSDEGALMSMRRKLSKAKAVRDEIEKIIGSPLGKILGGDDVGTRQKR